ncbi:MAG: alpha/beta fold hydrolase, partial [Myxococcota bacterium]
VVEHFNPNTLLGSWPGLSSGHHSVHEAGAATEAVEVEQITFTSGGDRLVGHLFTPVGLDRTQRHPAVVVVGSWTSVKEQMPDMYASRLAEQGFITLTFDFAGFGESAGLPRQLESPARKIQNIKDAVIVLGQRQEVDPSAISGLGICAGAGYMAHAVAQDERFSGLLLIAPWLHNEAMARMIYDARPVGAQGLIDASRRAQARFEEQGTMAYVLATSELDPLSAMFVPNNVFDYYLNPAKGAGAHYDNRFAVASWEGWITFDGVGAGRDLNTPVHIIHSESGAVPDGTRQFYAQLGQGSIEWLNDHTQEDFYHNPAAVNDAVAAATRALKAR